MNSPTAVTMMPSKSLARQLEQIGLCVIPAGLDDFLARAAKQRWSPRQRLEHLEQTEAAERARRRRPSDDATEPCWRLCSVAACAAARLLH
jgi:hypothetical protein